MTSTPKPGSEDAVWIDYLRDREKLFARALTGEEVAAARRSFEWRCSNDPIWVLNKKLTTRQGTVLPDFEALYEKRAEIDRRFKGDD